MINAGALFFALLAGLISATAQAASPHSTHPAAAAAAASTDAQPPPATAGELQQLLDTLQNDAARAKLIAQLQALVAVQRQTAPPKPGGVALLGRLSAQIDALTGEILAGTAMIVDAPRLIGWAREQLHSPARERWLDAAKAFVLVFGAAAAGEWALRWIIARVRPRQRAKEKV